MELRHLRHFIAIADRLSFSKAAQALHITQPALSRQIRELEEELGCALFQRLPTKIMLTAEGKHLLTQAVPLLRQADDIVRTMQARSPAQVRRIRLAHFGTFLELYLVPFLHRLHQRHPGWVCDLVEREPAAALRDLIRGDVDAAATGRAAPEFFVGLESRIFWNEPPLIVLPAQHPLAKRRRVKLRDLAGEKLLLWDEQEYPGFGNPFLAGCRAAGFEPVVARTVNSVADTFTAAARGEGIGYVGRLAAQLPAPGLVLVPLAGGEVDMPTLLAWRPESPGAALIEELADMLAAQPPAVRPAGPGSPR